MNPAAGFCQSEAECRTARSPMPVDWDWIEAVPRSILRVGLKYKVRVKFQPRTFPHGLVLMSISWDVTAKNHQPDTISCETLVTPNNGYPTGRYEISAQHHFVAQSDDGS